MYQENLKESALEILRLFFLIKIMRMTCGEFFFIQKLECELLHIVNSFFLGICCMIHCDELLAILHGN